MKKSETARIITMIAMYEDQAEPADEKTEAWHMIIGDLTYPECERVLKHFYKTESRRIWPADIYQGVWAERHEWVMKNPEVGPQHPELVPPWKTQKAIEGD